MHTDSVSREFALTLHFSQVYYHRILLFFLFVHSMGIRLHKVACECDSISFSLCYNIADVATDVYFTL